MTNQLKSLFIARLIVSGIPHHDAPNIADAMLDDIESTVEAQEDGECVVLTDHFEFCPFCDQEVY